MVREPSSIIYHEHAHRTRAFARARARVRVCVHAHILQASCAAIRLCCSFLSSIALLHVLVCSLPCPRTSCTSQVFTCNKVTGEPLTADYYPMFKRICRYADDKDPCDRHSYCMPNSHQCPPEERTPMLLNPGLTQASTVFGSVLFHNNHTLAVGVPTGVWHKAACGTKQLVPRVQYLFTRCNDDQGKALPRVFPQS